MNKIEEKAIKYSMTSYGESGDGFVEHPISKETCEFETQIDFKAGYKEALEDIGIWMKLNQDDIDRKGCIMIEQYLKQFE